jgi:hypothetical protein
MASEAQIAASRKAVATRIHGPDSPQVAAADRERRTALLAAHIRRVVDQAPPLTAGQRAQLALLLGVTPGPDGDGN